MTSGLTGKERQRTSAVASPQPATPAKQPGTSRWSGESRGAAHRHGRLPEKRPANRHRSAPPTGDSPPQERLASRHRSGRPTRAPVGVASTASAAQIHPTEVMRCARQAQETDSERLASGVRAGHEQCDDGVAGTAGDL